nr:voltage-dependent anion channel [Tanacetum cinerariifolium]
MGVAIVRSTPPNLDATTTANKETAANSMVSNQFVQDQLHMPSLVTHDAPELLESSSRFVKRKRMPTEDPNIYRMLSVAKSKKVRATVGTDHRRTTIVIRDTISKTLNTEPIVTIGVASHHWLWIDEAGAGKTPDRLMLPIKSPRMDELRDNRYNFFKTWPGHKFMLISPAVVMAATYESHSLQNSSTASFFLHTEDFNRANPSSSNHCKRTFTDIQEILLTCDMGIAWNVGRRGVTDGTTSTDRGVGYAYAVTRNSWEGSSFVHNDDALLHKHC